MLGFVGRFKLVFGDRIREALLQCGVYGIGLSGLASRSGLVAQAQHPKL